MRYRTLVLALFLSATTYAQAPPIVAAAPFTSMSRVPVSDFASDVVNAPGIQERPAIASDGASNVMAVWADQRYGNFDIFASRLDQYGLAIDKLGIPVAPTYFDDFDPAVAWNGSEYGVVWATQYGIFFARISRQGVVTGPQKIFDAFVANRTGLAAPAIAWNGSEYLVAFSFEEPNTSAATLDGVLIAADGSLRSDIFSISEALTGATNPSIATDGTNFLVAWDETQPRRAITALVSREGTVSARRILGNLPPAGPQWTTWYSSYAFPHIAFSGSEYAVVWTDWVLHAQLLTSSGEPSGAPRILSDASRFAITPSLTAADDGWIVVWSNSAVSPYPSDPETYVENLSTFDVYSEKLARDLSPIWVNVVDESVGGQVNTAVHRHGSGAVALWQDGSNVYTTALNANAQAAEIYGARPALAYGIANQKEVAVAVSGDIALVVWRSPDGNAAFSRRYRSDGKPLDAEPSAIWWGDPAGFLADPYSVSVTASQNAFLEVFTDPVSHGIIVRRIEREGYSIDPWGYPLGVTAPAGSRPSAASDGHDFLVAWAAQTEATDLFGTPLEEIRAKIVTASGNASNEFVVAPVSSSHYFNPIVTWAGDKYAIAWTTFQQSVYPLTGISMRYGGPGGTLLGDVIAVEEIRHYGQAAISIASDGRTVVIGAGMPDYASLYAIDGSSVSQIVSAGPYVTWDGSRLVNGDFPLASFGNGRNVAVGSELVRMLPQAHAGGVNRVYVGFFNSLRTRAVRRY